MNNKNSSSHNETLSYSTFTTPRQSSSSNTQMGAHKRHRSSSTSSIETLKDMDQNSRHQQNTSKLHDNNNTPPSYFGSFSSTLYIENHASVARDHMANERTYLAWVRTSLSTISIGVALTQIFRFDKTILQHPEAAEELQAVGTPLGIAFILIGMFYLICACIRYFHSQDALTKGYFPASRGIVILASASTFIALVSLFFVISKNH